jgi:peptidyl-prolyl cis-trans isomerase B (cyclophilin B)
MLVRRLLPLFLLSLALLVGACGGSDKKSEKEATPAAGAQGTPSSGEETGCTEAQPTGEQVKSPKKPTAKLNPSKRYVVHFTTNCGDFEITLAVKKAPKIAASFASLVRQGFFDGLTFHRVVPGFVIQGGDPEGNGQGGPGYSVTEAPPKDLAYTRGVVAMAKTGTEAPGTSGSQFFVVTGENAGLPPEYGLLGRVTKGEDVVAAIGVVPTRPDEQPVSPVVMTKVTLTEQ